MMGGGGGTTTWMIGEVATEDEDKEGPDSVEGVICGRLNFGGSRLQHSWVKDDSSHKTVRPCSNQASPRKGIEVKVLRGSRLL
jgi:hypothetical protein